MNEAIDTLRLIYAYLLNREPDQAAIDTYLPLLESNLDEGKIFIQQAIKQSDEYSTNISLLLPVETSLLDNYQQLVAMGQDFIKTKKVVFLGLARNLENKLEKSITKLLDFGKTAQKYKVVIFENDSVDNTKKILEKLSRNDSNIIYFSENNNRPQFGTVKDTERTIALAEYRNKLLTHVKQHLSEYDFIVVTDLDFIDFSIPGVYNTFGWFDRFGQSVGAIAGNSYEYKYVTSDTSKSLWNYDSWALRYSWWNELPNLPSVTYNRMWWFGFWIMSAGLPLMPVNSAFGGMAIYRTEHFIKGSYSGYDCEHVCFHYSLKQNSPNFRLMLNPSQMMLV